MIASHDDVVSSRSVPAALVAFRAITKDKSQHDSTGEVLFMLWEEGDYSIKHLKDIANMLQMALQYA